MYKVLTIAGSDSGGGAGIQADLKTFSAYGVYGMSVISAVTSQNTVGVSGFQALSAKFVGQQITDVLSDIGAGAVKTGMLPTDEIIIEVAERVKHFNVTNLVVDPVMVASAGARLIHKSAEKALVDKLIPQARIVTPNLPEAEVLSGIKIKTPEDTQRAAQIISGLGPRTVLIKGGHSIGEAVDFLFEDGRFFTFRMPRVETPNSHGTGCTLSAAIAAGLAMGMSVRQAVETAKNYIQLALLHSLSIGSGHGPTNHLAGYYDDVSGTIRPDRRFFNGDTGQSNFPLSQKLKGKELYVVTGHEFAKGRPIVEIVRQALAGGAGIIQLREKEWSTRQLIEAGTQLKALTQEYGALFIVNDRIDVAQAVHADGIHVGQDDMPARTARKILGPDIMIGVSAETVEQAKAAEQEGADYIGCGPVFYTDTKPDAGKPTGLQLLADVRKAVNIPVYGIGGIKLDNVSEVMAAGADGAAIITAVIGAEDVKLAAQAFTQIMKGWRN